MGSSKSKLNQEPRVAQIPEPETTLSEMKTDVLLHELKKAMMLLTSYRNNNMSELLQTIQRDPKLMQELKDDAGIDFGDANGPVKIVGHFDKKMQYWLTKKNPVELNANVISNPTKLYKLIEDAEKERLAQKLTEIVRTGIFGSFDEQELRSNEQYKTVKEMMEQIARRNAHEDYYKYEYYISLMWISSYLMKVKTAVTEFTENTIKTVEEKERQRNAYVGDLLKNLLSVMMGTHQDIDVELYESFRKHFDEFREKTTKLSVKSAEELSDIRQTMNERLKAQMPMPGQSRRQDQQGGFVRDGSRFPEAFFEGQSGGFVRDGSRFPQSFYDLE